MPRWQPAASSWAGAPRAYVKIQGSVQQRSVGTYSQRGVLRGHGIQLATLSLPLSTSSRIVITAMLEQFGNGACANVINS